MIQDTRVALRSFDRVLLQSPTGSGKTVLASFMSGSALSKGLRVGFICHRRELIKQTAKTFTRAGLPFGIVSAGITGDRRAPIQICGIQTLANRLDFFKHFDLVLWDEAHHVAAASWARVMEQYASAKHVGLSATPERMDGNGLAQWFQTLVPGPKVSWLIENGYLSPYRLFQPAMPDLDGVRAGGNDFNRDDLSAAMQKPKLIGDMVEHYHRIAPGKRNMVFCVSVKHSLAVVDRFNAAGYRAAHIDGDTDSKVRDDLIDDFTAGRIQVLSSVDLVSEGFDLPAIEVATLARPTRSTALYLQQVGRALRIAEGKTEAIILDHAGNSVPTHLGGRGHGYPDDDREWTLEGRKKRKRKSDEFNDEEEAQVEMRRCPHCYHAHRPAPVCSRCGYEYPVEGRTLLEAEGELTEVRKAQQQKAERVEVWKATTEAELIQLGKLRGYKNPGFWAKKVMQSRNAKANRDYGGLFR
ncbi:hypothetical protein BA190_09560 [Labrys sp. WJW]|nr:hypothetical protein BA190_09560 [Labrys sp. WJW]